MRCCSREVHGEKVCELCVEVVRMAVRADARGISCLNMSAEDARQRREEGSRLCESELLC